MKTKSEIMTAAHKIARTLEGDYVARMKAALEIVWLQEVLEENMNVSTVKEILESDDYDSRAICKVVCFFSNGFQADIARNFLEFGKRMSYKQAWCVAYEYKRVA